MRSEFLFVFAFLAVAVVGTRFLDGRTDEAALGEQALLEAAEAAEAARLNAYYSRGRDEEVRVRPGAHNQYFLTAAVNESPADFVVDTGASYVAMRESDALSAGVYTKLSDYTHPVRTANGETKAALVKLRAIEVGGIRIENVDAFVLPDAQLGVNLLGMSFLSRLKSMEARDGELVLKG